VNLSAQQTGQRLDNVSSAIVLRLMREGHLPSINQPNPGAKRFVPKFDSKVVEEFRKTKWPEIKAKRPRRGSLVNGTPPRIARTRQAVPAVGAYRSGSPEDGGRLSRIEAKLDLILHLLNQL
jgi:hypothetical protein